MIFKENFKIQLKDIGKNNYLKNIGILEILENIGTHHSDIVGYGPNNIQEKGVSWVLLDWKIQVLNRPKYGQNLNVNTWARPINGEIKKTHTYRDFEIYNQQNELCVIGTSKWVLVDINTGRIARINDEVIKKYELEDRSVFNNEELGKINTPEVFNNELEYNVARRDIDLNGHMHNLYYLDLAYETLPQDVYEKRPFDNFRIQYKKEIKFGDVIKCKYTFDNNEHIVTIFNENNTKVHAIIILK